MMRTALIATRAIAREHIAEAKPVVVETDADIARPELDDGECIDFDRSELLAALRRRRSVRPASLASAVSRRSSRRADHDSWLLLVFVQPIGGEELAAATTGAFAGEPSIGLDR